MHAQLLSHAQLFATLWNPPGPSVDGVFHARILKWVAISSSRGSSWPRDQTHISCISCMAREILYHWATREAPILPYYPVNGSEYLSKNGICCLQKFKGPIRHFTYLIVGGVRCNHLSFTLEGTEVGERTEIHIQFFSHFLEWMSRLILQCQFLLIWST